MRGLRPIAWFLALTWVGGVLPGALLLGGSAAATAGRAPARPAPAVSGGSAPKALCRGCEVFVLNVPLEPTRTPFGREPNTTVRVKATLPGGWSKASCGDVYGVVARDATTEDGLAVAEWQCDQSKNTLRFWGPPEGETSGAAVRFNFRARSPGPTSPANPLAAGFIEVTQTYADGEVQRRRGAKQLLATRPPAQTSKDATVWLPPDWIVPDCSVPFNAVGDSVTGWNCRVDVLAGSKYRVRWTKVSGKNSGKNHARLFYFHAFTKQHPFKTAEHRPHKSHKKPGFDKTYPFPYQQGFDSTYPFPKQGRPVTPVSFAGLTKVIDLMFEDGHIPAVLIAHLRAGDPPPPTYSPTPQATVIVRPKGERKRKYDDPCLPAGVYSNPTSTPRPGSVEFPYGPPPGYPGFGWYGSYGDPCVPPRVVVDPCAAKYFSEQGHGRFKPEPREVASACHPPETDEGEVPGVHDGPQEPFYDSEAVHPREGCILRPGQRPDGDRGDRAHHRAPLAPVVDPTPAPAAPADRESGAGASGDFDERVRGLVSSTTPSPQPTIRALLPEQPAAALEPAPGLMYCDDLPRTGGRSAPVFQLALAVIVIGAVLVLGAVYWRRYSYRERWYSGY